MYREHTCTRCKKDIEDIEVTIKLGISARRKKENGIWENIANLDQESLEILCPDCFNLFCDSLNSLNYENTPGPQSSQFNPPQHSPKYDIPEEDPIKVDDQVDYR